MNEDIRKDLEIDEEELERVSGGEDTGSIILRCTPCTKCHFPATEFKKGSNKYICTQCGNIFMFQQLS